MGGSFQAREEFPGKSTGVGCHCLLPSYSLLRNNSECAQRCLYQIVHLSDTDSSKKYETTYDQQSKWLNNLLSVSTVGCYRAVKKVETYMILFLSVH